MFPMAVLQAVLLVLFTKNYLLYNELDGWIALVRWGDAASVIHCALRVWLGPVSVAWAKPIPEI